MADGLGTGFSSQLILEENDITKPLFVNKTILVPIYNTRYDFLKYEFQARITQWEDFEENWREEKGYWKTKFSGDEKGLAIMEQLLNERRKNTTGHTD